MYEYYTDCILVIRRLVDSFKCETE